MGPPRTGPQNTRTRNKQGKLNMSEQVETSPLNERWRESLRGGVERSEIINWSLSQCENWVVFTAGVTVITAHL